MSATPDRIAACLETIRASTALEPAIGVVLGSGLGGVADRIETAPDAPMPGDEVSRIWTPDARVA